LISIIVPVFGVEPFLDECVLSIIRQTYTDIEIILVDDGSPDCCDRICDHYADLDSRIHVIHKKSSGPSDARNAGLQVAKGDYIGFVDSDDFIASDMFASLLSLIESTQSDMAICGHVKTTHNGKPGLYLRSKKVRIMESEEALAKMLQIGHYESFVWNKLCKRELYEGIEFPSGHLYEDLYTMYKIIDRAHQIAYSRKVKYFYRQRLGSVIHSVYSVKYYDYVNSSIEVREFIEKKYPDIYRTASMALYRARIFTFFRILFSRPFILFSRQSRREGLYKYVRSIISSIR